MTWFLLAVSCIILWSVTDILLKVSSDVNDPMCHYKNFIWIGIVMGIASGIMCTWTDTLPESAKLVLGEGWYLVPLLLIYGVALLFGLLGMKHLDCSVVAPLENIDGALTAIIIYFYYLLTGYIDPSYTFGALDIIAALFVIFGVINLGSYEQDMLKEEVPLSPEKRKHRFGAFALFFPLIYTLVDVFSIAEVSGVSGTSGIVNESAEASIPPIDFFIFECAGFAILALCLWAYLAFAKKYVYNPFQPEEMVRCGAATGETFGTMTFLLAAAINPVLTAPVTSSYCVVTILLARFFLKERLSKKQIVSLVFLILGVAMLGISEVISA